MSGLRDERLSDEDLERYAELTDPSDPYPAEFVGLLARELLARRKAEAPSWVVSAFNHNSLWGAVEDVNSGRTISFHSTSYHGRTWPVVGERVDVVFNRAGELLAVHEVT